MSDRKRHLAVGVTTIFGLAGLGFLLLVFGAMPSWFEQGYTVTLDLPDAGGLSVGSRVRMADMNIGEVRDIELRDPPQAGVRTVLKIREPYLIPQNATFRVDPGPLLGGSPFVSIELGNVGEADAVYLATDNSARVQGMTGGRANNMAEGLSRAVQPLMAEVKRLVDKFDELSTEWTRVGQSVNRLTEPRDLSDVDAGKVEGNLSTALARADQRLAEMEKLIKSMDQFVNDPAFRKEIRDVAANMNKAAEKVGSAADSAAELTRSADATVKKLSGEIERLSKRYYAVADDLSAAITSARQTIDLASKGKGTVAKLLNDPALYNNLNDSVTRAEQALSELKQLIEKLKDEGLPVKLGG